MNNEPTNGTEVNVAAFEARAKILDNFLRGLFLLNGGAAIAILTFVGQMVDNNPKLAAGIVWQLVVFALGALASVGCHLVRFSRAFIKKTPEMYVPLDRYSAAWIILALISVGLFVFGCINTAVIARSVLG